jgi:hypothetical protein
MSFITIFEAPEVEAARLAEAPVGSKSHALSSMPVNISGYLEDLMIELSFGEHTVVVVPFERYKDSDEVRVMPFRRHDGSWKCAVVASDHPSYPVGGHRLSITEAELVRGTLRNFELPTTPAPLEIQGAPAQLELTA